MTILDFRIQILDLRAQRLSAKKSCSLNLQSEIRNLQYSITPSILNPLRGQDNLISSGCEYLLFLDNLDGDFGCHISMYLNRNLVFTQGLYRFI